MEKLEDFFEFAAYVGLTKHLGGHDATETLAALCHIDEGKHVLDVGCGAGTTACFFAKTYGCTVVGVDISDAMIERCEERAKREGVGDRVTFRVADAQDLPFEDGRFDAVVTESVTAFPEDKTQAVREYARVTKSGGYIGLNESTWLKVPPPPEMIAWVSQDVGANANPLTSEEWAALLAGAGLQDIHAETHAVVVRDEVSGLLRRYGCRGMLGVYGRILMLSLRNPAYRRFLKETREIGIAPDNIDEYFGYGLYVGRK